MVRRVVWLMVCQVERREASLMVLGCLLKMAMVGMEERREAPQMVLGCLLEELAMVCLGEVPWMVVGCLSLSW